MKLWVLVLYYCWREEKYTSKNSNMFFWNGRLGPPLSPNCVNAVELYRRLELTVMTFPSLLALCSPGTTQDATICLTSHSVTTMILSVTTCVWTVLTIFRTAAHVISSESGECEAHAQADPKDKEKRQVTALSDKSKRTMWTAAVQRHCRVNVPAVWFMRR
jgi:type VI protein secretion system component VasK